MVDGIPGCRKSEILYHVAQMYPGTSTPILCNILDTIPSAATLFDTDNEDEFKQSFLTTQLFVISAMMDLMGQIQERPISRDHIFIIESSIFWPWLWIETFFDMQILTDFEREVLHNLLRMVIIKWGHFIHKNQLKLVHIYIHRKMDKPYMIMSKPHTFQIKSYMWSKFPNLWDNLNANYAHFAHFVSLLTHDILPINSFYHYIISDHIAEDHIFTVKSMAHMIAEKLQPLDDFAYSRDENTLVLNFDDF